ncbi:hypothetical protein CspHIS471_0608410 [Cutaneotrichosporon sp. HIS471]|nr:hypothetical protein CspHIS471_0608410 [Cutaneotrichosporon sp. HIS471]
MGHVDPHTIKIIPAAAKRFMSAPRYAVVGRVLQDPAKFDNKLIRWYQERKMNVTPVRPASDRFDNSKPVEGVQVVESPLALPDLRNTSLSMIISPKLGYDFLKQLYADPAKKPHSMWFQPGAENDEIEAFIKEHNLSDEIVIGGPCVLVHGDEARQQAGKA